MARGRREAATKAQIASLGLALSKPSASPLEMFPKGWWL